MPSPRLTGSPWSTSPRCPADYRDDVRRLALLTTPFLLFAVAIGLALDTRYSVQIGMLPRGDDDRVFRLLKALGFFLWHPALELRTPSGEWSLLRGLEEFREHLGGELTITLLRAIGRGEEVHRMDADEILQAMGWLRRRETGR